MVRHQKQQKKCTQILILIANRILKLLIHCFHHSKKTGSIYNLCATQSYPNYSSAMNHRRSFCTAQKVADQDQAPQNTCSIRPTIIPGFLNALKKIIAPAPHPAKLHSNGLEHQIDLPTFAEVKESSSFQTNLTKEINTMASSTECNNENTADISAMQKNRRNKRGKRRSKNKKSLHVDKTNEEINKQFQIKQLHHNSRELHKNVHEKIRHAIGKDMNEDLNEGEANTRTSPVEEDDIIQKSDSKDSFAIVTVQTADDNKMLFSPEDFPPIAQSCPAQGPRMRDCIKNRSPPRQIQSLLDSGSDDDDFIIFRHDAPKSTPSVVARKSNFCGKINKILTATSPKIASLKMSFQKSADCVFAPKRERLMSECSDDSFVIFYDPDCPTTSTKHDDDFESDSEDFSEDDEEKSIKTMGSTEDLHPPDSGFEEKKVRFNLSLEIHEMRVWNFAYRMARKGHWEIFVRDRDRFNKKIKCFETILQPILEPQHRIKVHQERFENSCQ